MNTNCLEGMECPKCGSPEPFKIQGTAVFRVLDNGSDTFQDLSWDDTSPIMCDRCGWEGVVLDTRLHDRRKASAAVNAIWDALYRRADGTIDPDKEWDSDVMDTVANAINPLRPPPD